MPVNRGGRLLPSYREIARLIGAGVTVVLRLSGFRRAGLQQGDLLVRRHDWSGQPVNGRRSLHGRGVSTGCIQG
jgi:hypothetical protein